MIGTDVGAAPAVVAGSAAGLAAAGFTAAGSATVGTPVWSAAAGSPGVGLVLDPDALARSVALDALHRQASGLVAISSRLALAADRVPANADGTWSGPAGHACELALRSLRTSVASAQAAVTAASAETGRAIASFQARSG